MPPLDPQPEVEGNQAEMPYDPLPDILRKLRDAVKTLLAKWTNRVCSNLDLSRVLS
jgi:hypothetical protein